MLEQLSSLFSNLGKVLTSLLRVLLLSRFRRPFAQAGSQKPLLILGNGPSLRESLHDLDKWSRQPELLAVNFFADTDFYASTKPRYYVLAAPEFWIGDVDQSYIDARNRLFANLNSRTDWPMVLFIPFASRSFLEGMKVFSSNPMIQVEYFNTTPVEGWHWFAHLFFRLNLGMPRPHNVLIPSIVIGTNAGFRELLLAGADHSWLPQISVDDQNRVLINQQHFYDHDRSRPETMKKLGRGSRKLHEVLHKFMLSFEGYFVLNRYAISKGVKIWNVTPGSFIDAFDRQPLRNFTNPND